MNNKDRRNIDPEIIKHLEEDEQWKEHFSNDMKTMQENHKEIMDRLDKFITRSEPMLVYFEGLTFTRRFTLGLIGFMAAVLGLGLMIKQLFR